MLLGPLDAAQSISIPIGQPPPFNFRGDTVTIPGPSSSSSSITIATKSHFLILHPDLLITVTALFNAPRRSRKPRLSSHVRSSTETTPALLWVHVLHEVMLAYSLEGMDKRSSLISSPIHGQYAPSEALSARHHRAHRLRRRHRVTYYGLNGKLDSTTHAIISDLILPSPLFALPSNHANPHRCNPPPFKIKQGPLST